MAIMYYGWAAEEAKDCPDETCAPRILLWRAKSYIYGWGVDIDLKEAGKQLESAYKLAKQQMKMYNDWHVRQCFRQIIKTKKELYRKMKDK